jgi:Cu2+-exporting ATPase
VKARADLASALARFLTEQDGIESVRVGRTSGSVVVCYDPNSWDGVSILMLVRAYNPDITAIEARETQNEEEQGNEGSLERHKLEVALAGSALALTMVFGAPANLLAYALLWASSWSIFRRAYSSLLVDRRLTVDTLDAAAITLLSMRGMFWQAALLNVLLSSADWIRASTQERARTALCEVLDYMQDRAWIVRKGRVISVPAQEVRIGDTILVFPGERIPVDGIVLAGEALVDQHALTGESMPVQKKAQDPVYAATVINEGELRVRTVRTGDQTEVARIIQMVQHAPVFDTRAQNYAERWANRLVPYSFLGAGILALLGRFDQAITLLVIDYAAGFKIAAPTTVMATMTKAARRGIFIRGGRHVEQLAQIDALVFDKTGTLTWGCPDVVGLVTMDPRYDVDAVLALAAAAEQHLTHPVAQAIAKTAEAKGLNILERTSFDYEIGQGVTAQIEGLTVQVGSRRFLAHHEILINEEAETQLNLFEAHAAAPLCVAVDGILVGLLGLADPIRPESAGVIQALRRRGIDRVVMLTGDRGPVAATVAHEVGIEQYVAEAFPADKLRTVRALQEQGYTVAVIGDGINDSPALAQADIGIAVNGSTALAQETADVVILQGDLEKMVDAIDIARDGMALVRQNWEIVRIPNTVGLGLAFTGVIGPLGASLISDGAALVAGANSLRPLANSSDGTQFTAEHELTDTPSSEMCERSVLLPAKTHRLDGASDL